MRLFFILCCLLPLATYPQTIEQRTFYSVQIQDGFIIKIRKPANYSDKKAYYHIYVADGSLKLGNYILGTDADWKADVPEHCIIISFAHIGDWHMKRQRDFIPSDAGGHKTKEFGRASDFYWFLKRGLIPYVNNKFPLKKSSAFIGHSFSGLFCLYTLFQEDKLFDRHFAISPSVWANYYELLKIEKNYADKNKSLNARVDLQAGGLEVLNKVLSSTKEFLTTTESRNYAGYMIGFSTVNNANHFSIIKPGVDKVLAQFKE